MEPPQKNWTQKKKKKKKKKKQPLKKKKKKKNIGPTIRIGQEIQCLLYAGFLLEFLKAVCLGFVHIPKIGKYLFKSLSKLVFNTVRIRSMLMLARPRMCFKLFFFF